MHQNIVEIEFLKNNINNTDCFIVKDILYIFFTYFFSRENDDISNVYLRRSQDD